MLVCQSNLQTSLIKYDICLNCFSYYIQPEIHLKQASQSISYMPLFPVKNDGRLLTVIFRRRAFKPTVIAADDCTFPYIVFTF